MSCLCSKNKEFYDVDVDFHNLYYKSRYRSVIHCTDKKKNKHKDHEDRAFKVSLDWKHKIGKAAQTVFKTQNWAQIKNNRIIDYCKLFLSIVNLMTFFLIAHRNFISVFDLQNKQWLSEHFQFKDEVRCLEVMRSHQKVEVATPLDRTKTQIIRENKIEADKRFFAIVFVGTNSIKKLEISQDFSSVREDLSNPIEVQGRILKIKRDSIENTGAYILCDHGKHKATFKEFGKFKLRNK